MPKTLSAKTYSDGEMAAAIRAVRCGSSIRAAASKFSVPRTTLKLRLDGKGNAPRGPSPILTSQEEKVLVSWIISLQKKGFPRRPEDVQDSVKCFLDAAGRENPFVDNRPGKK